MPYPQDPHGTSYENTRTREGGGTDWVHRPPGLSAREAFIAAYDRLRELAGVAQRPAMLAAAVDPYGQTVDSALIAPGHSLILGRHTGCGLRLLDEGFALRHLVAHARPAPPGAAPLIRLWDLHTWRAFITEDGQPCVAVTAQPRRRSLGPVPSTPVHGGMPARSPPASPPALGSGRPAHARRRVRSSSREPGPLSRVSPSYLLRRFPRARFMG
jgi:hypothetical protein